MSSDCLTREKNMRLALELAVEAGRAGEVPVGCVITGPDGEILGRGRNRKEELGDPTAHAEMLAIREACGKRGDWRLDGCTLYVTLEPCPMCAGALINSRISELVFGAREELTGSCGSVTDLFMERYPASPRVFKGVLEEESSGLLSAFFSGKRKQSAPLTAEEPAD